MSRGGQWGDDDALVVAVGGRSHEALREIYRRHGGAVWVVAKRVCGSAEPAEQVCEAVFTELWSHPERFEPARGGLRSWLVVQVHTRAVALVGHDVERDAVLLAYVGGHSCSETARLLGTTEGIVKSSIRRGLLNLRHTLHAEGVTG